MNVTAWHDATASLSLSESWGRSRKRRRPGGALQELPRLHHHCVWHFYIPRSSTGLTRLRIDSPNAGLHFVKLPTYQRPITSAVHNGLKSFTGFADRRQTTTGT